MIVHTVKSTRKGLIEFEGGAAVEIEPPEKLNIGDIVQIQITGVLRQFIDWMRWTDKDGQVHFIRYKEGTPVNES